MPVEEEFHASALPVSCQWKKKRVPSRFLLAAGQKNLPAAPFPNNTANHKQNKKKRRIKEISANIA